MQVSPDSSPAPLSTEQAAAADVPLQQAQGHSLLKNTLYLSIAQAVTIPIAVASNALVGRYLGSEEFGYLYLASTLCSFAVLPLEWGQQGALPALVARDRTQTAMYLGTSLAWRGVMGVLISGVLALICIALDYQVALRWTVGLSFAIAILNSFAGAFKDTIRGFERTDIPALSHVAQQILALLVTVPVLLLGGHLKALLTAYIPVTLFTVLFLHRSLRSMGTGALRYTRAALNQLFSLGTPFVFFWLAMALQPQVNAMFLSKLVPAEVIGWYGVSQRLIGLILFPASALIGALYPTLCRLYTEDKDQFVSTSRNSLYGVSLLAIPAAVGTGLFPELGVAIFGTKEFAGAADHLRLMSVFVFLVYFSMPLGTSILAANKQKAWALVQCVCILVGVVGNPLLIPYFQTRMKNGAIGTCVTLVIAEAVVVGCGVALAPRGLFDRGFFKSMSLSVVAGAAMVGVALLTKPISMFLAVPASLLTYGVVAWFSGAVQPSTMAQIKGFLGRKLARFRS
jgi:O-antigen/teichoic acid export membrane protein